MQRILAGRRGRFFCPQGGLSAPERHLGPRDSTELGGRYGGQTGGCQGGVERNEYAEPAIGWAGAAPGRRSVPWPGWARGERAGGGGRRGPGGRGQGGGGRGVIEWRQRGE